MLLSFSIKFYIMVYFNMHHICCIEVLLICGSYATSAFCKYVYFALFYLLHWHEVLKSLICCRLKLFYITSQILSLNSRHCIILYLLTNLSLKKEKKYRFDAFAFHLLILDCTVFCTWPPWTNLSASLSNETFSESLFTVILKLLSQNPS